MEKVVYLCHTFSAGITNNKDVEVKGEKGMRMGGGKHVLRDWISGLMCPVVTIVMLG